MRDKLNICTIERYDHYIPWTDKTIDKGIALLNTAPPNPNYDGQYAYQQFLYAIEKIQMMYSRGDSLAELRAYFPKVIELMQWAWDNYETKYFDRDTLDRRKLFRVNFDRYVLCLWLYSFAICLNIERRLLDQLMVLIGNEGEDALFDRLAARQYPARTIGATLIYPRVFQSLYDALDAPQAKRATLLVKYVTKWYASMKRANWHDTHLGKELGGYNGYWCFEVAGVVKTFGLDDSAIEDLPYYPKDLAHG